MPEGHSVKRLANTFDRWFTGTQVFASSPQGRFTDGAELLNGRVMAEATSHGKHMFLRFEDPDDPTSDSLWLHVHLGLYGAWRFHGDSELAIEESIGAPRASAVTEDTGFLPGRRENEGLTLAAVDADDGVWEPPEPVGQVRVRLENDSVAADLAGPTRCEVATPQEVQETLDRLGPDPLDHDSDPKQLQQEFVENVRASKRTIGELVMDQSVIAGVGNIYRAEGLFRTGISPNRRGANVSEERLKRLWDDYVYLLDKGVMEGRITTVRDADKPDLEVVEEDDLESQRWYVYHRSGRDCSVCGNPVSEKLVANRRMFWCSTCQR